MIGVIADDLTGAMDAGAQFAITGLITMLLLSDTQISPADVLVINTDSREKNEEDAKRRAADAVERLQGRLLFKKVDSTMRGNVGAEIESILKMTKRAKAVICPAVIEEDRKVIDGRLWVNGVPLHQSDFVIDPTWPASTSEVVALLNLPATCIPISIVRAGVRSLIRAFKDAGEKLVIVDAINEMDLAVIGQAIVTADLLPCGALGLARAWVSKLTGQDICNSDVTFEDVHEPIVVVAGSHHKKSLLQIEHLVSEWDIAVIEVTVESIDKEESLWDLLSKALSEGRSVVLHSQVEETPFIKERQDLQTLLGKLALKSCQVFDPGGLIIIGGETASSVCDAFKPAAVHILGELQDGVPWGMLVGGAVPGLSIFTKAGGFGMEDTLIRIFDRILSYRCLPGSQYGEGI